MKAILLASALFAASNAQSTCSQLDVSGQVYVQRGTSKGLRIVSKCADASIGRVEVYDDTLGWGTYTQCSSYTTTYFDTYEADTVCKELGFSAGALTLSSTYNTRYSWFGNDSYVQAGNLEIDYLPTYCTGSYASCSLLDDNFCEDCWVDDASDWTSCSTTSTCHTSDAYVACDTTGTTPSSPTRYTSNPSGQSGDDCSDEWFEDAAEALATIFIVLIVIGVVIFLGIIGCIVCCICGGVACCAASARKNNP